MSRHHTFVALLVVAAWSTLGAQEPPGSRVPPEVRAAQEFLFAAYPDLARQPLGVQIKPEGSAWLVSVAEAPPAGQPGAPIVPVPPSVLLRGTIAFDGAGRLAGYRADGSYLSDGPNAVLRDTVRTHPAWTDGDADVELMRLGGSSMIALAFTPAASPAAPELTRFLGAAATAEPARFVWWAQGPDGMSPPVVTALWVIDATATNSSGPAVRYQFSYEPIGGRLVGVTKLGGAE